LFISSFPWLFLATSVFGVPQVGTLFLLFWRDLGGLFPGWHGIASHRVLESGRGEDESQADRIGADVLQTYPSVRGNKYKSPCVEIALLIAEPNMSLAAVDQHYFILNQVPVLWYSCSGGEFLGTRHKMLRAVVLWADFQYELGGGGDTGVRVNTASTHLAFVPLQKKRLNIGF
jgi:hypothetical protein